MHKLMTYKLASISIAYTLSQLEYTYYSGDSCGFEFFRPLFHFSFSFNSALYIVSISVQRRILVTYMIKFWI